MIPRAHVAMVGALGLLAACRPDPVRPDADADVDAAPPWEAAAVPAPRPGMIWIPDGVLVAGTPPDRLPRVADEEMAGEQVVMRAFYIDAFPFPNEVGAIPMTNLSHEQATARCVDQGKRLCTELELERACKGPENLTYDYGDTYRAATCGTGTARALVPNGYNAGCESGFGVHDLHGGPWTWTASPWGRDGERPNDFTLRGGNGKPGELLGRCANARSMKPTLRREDVGVRCCAGEPNTFEVVLQVTRGEALVWQPPDKTIAPQLEALVPEEIQAAVRDHKGASAFKVERMWTWHPLGNEEVVLGGGCAKTPGHSRCGVLAARVRSDVATAMAFVETDWWQPTVGQADSPREIFVYGGDDNGAFRKRVSYEWGRVTSGEKARKKRVKGSKVVTYQ